MLVRKASLSKKGVDNSEMKRKRTGSSIKAAGDEDNSGYGYEKVMTINMGVGGMAHTCVRPVNKHARATTQWEYYRT